MKKEVFESSVDSKLKIAGFIYDDIKTEADGSIKPKGAVQILHGMTDRMQRYEELAARLNREGYVMFGIDMLGHGETYVLNKELGMPQGYFGGGKDDYKKIMADDEKMREIVSKMYPDVPMILYGHSMGSFVCREMYSVDEYSKNYEGFIFSSTMGKNPAVGFGIFLSNLLSGLGLGKKKSNLLNTIAFGSYNSHYKPRRTNYDWLSTDEHEVDVYMADPLCNFTFTHRGFGDLFRYVRDIQKTSTYEKCSRKPCLLPYCTEDPVGSYGKGVEQVYDMYIKHGADARKVNFGAYRHEPLNDVIRNEYMDALVKFIDEVCAKA